MMTLLQNQQKMKYSLPLENIPIYERDEEGNIIYYEDSEGNRIPYDTGERETGYTEPVSFFACISNKLNEVVWKDYGIDNSTNYAQIIVPKGSIGLKLGAIVWKKSDVGFTASGIIDETTADYTVKGIADEGLSEDLFLLRRNVG